LFGVLIETAWRDVLVVGYLLGSALMIAAGLTEWRLGIDAEQKALEDIASPLSVVQAEETSPEVRT
jgi:hypothetical protein